jgi:hypothetical protein
VADLYRSVIVFPGSHTSALRHCPSCRVRGHQGFQCRGTWGRQCSANQALEPMSFAPFVSYALCRFG